VTDTSLSGRAAQKFVCLGEVSEPAGNDVWHGREAGPVQSHAGGGHVMIRDPGGVVDEHCGSGPEDLRQPRTSQVIAR
jgi:hypothetical protein